MATDSDLREWNDARNWRGGWLDVYVGPRDRRQLVPARRRGFGWTPNYGRRATWAALVALYVAMVAGVLALAVWRGPRSPTQMLSAPASRP